MRTATVKFILLAGTALTGLVGSFSTYAFNFSPSKLEYLSSSPSCQIALSRHARNADYLKSIQLPPRGNRTLQEMIWKTGWWHYCAGKILIKRAQISAEGPEKQQIIDNAISQINFSLKKTDPSHPAAVDMAISLAQVHILSGDYPAADELLNNMLEIRPDNVALLSSFALSQYRQENYGKAMEYYEQANSAAQERSAEIIYSIGLSAYRLGDIEKAKDFAERAKSMGYPHTGLRDLIKSYSH